MIERRAAGVRISLVSEDGKRSALPADLAGRLMSFTFTESEKKADSATLELRNTDLSLFENEDIAAGKTLEVSWGYPGRMSSPRRVVIKKRKGFEKLRIEGRAESAQLDRVKKTRGFESKSRPDVARAIAEEHGYAPSAQFVGPPGEALDMVNQAGETDAHFLSRLAREEGVHFFIDDAGFHFREERQEAAPTLALRWRGGDTGEIISIGDVDINTARRAGKVTVKGRDPLEKTTISESADNDSEKRFALSDFIEVIDPDKGGSVLQSKNATSDESASSAKDANAAKAEASRRFKTAERESIKITLTARGNPALRAKTIVRLEGISKTLSGNYRITDATTKVAATGYTIELNTVRDGTSAADGNHKGDKNDKKEQDKKKLEMFEEVDPDTGGTILGYRRPPG